MTPRYDVTCPKFGVESGLPCRSIITRRVTDTHKARIEAQSVPFWARQHDIPADPDDTDPWTEGEV